MAQRLKFTKTFSGVNAYDLNRATNEFLLAMRHFDDVEFLPLVTADAGEAGVSVPMLYQTVVLHIEFNEKEAGALADLEIVVRKINEHIR